MLNKIILQGRFTKKPEITEVGNYKKTEFTVAWSEKYKETEKKCFLRCQAWNAQAEFICKYFDKGSECVIEGRTITDEWLKDGMTQSRTYCEIEKVNFCGSKSSNNNSIASTSNNAFMDIPEGIEEEIPFK